MVNSRGGGKNLKSRTSETIGSTAESVSLFATVEDETLDPSATVEITG